MMKPSHLVWFRLSLPQVQMCLPVHPWRADMQVSECVLWKECYYIHVFTSHACLLLQREPTCWVSFCRIAWEHDVFLKCVTFLILRKRKCNFRCHVNIPGKFESWKLLTMTLQLLFCQSYCDILWWVVLCLNWYFSVNIRIYFVHLKYIYKDISNRK